jgi:hypothetical protein
MRGMGKRAALGAVAALLVPSAAAADRVIAVDVQASSTAPSKVDTFAAWRVVDGSTGTAWCEGKDDEGLEETLTLTLARPVRVTRIDLYVGLHGSAKEYKDHNRPSKLVARTAPRRGDAMKLLAGAVPMVSDHDTLVKLDLETPRKVQVLELGLAGVARGEKERNNHTCITDISLLGEKGEVIHFVYGMPLDAMAELAAAVGRLRTAVAACDEAVLSTAVTFPLAHRVSAEEDSRTVTLKNARALVKACKAGDFPKIPPEADRPGISANGFGGVSLETGAADVSRLDLQWVNGAWALSGIESY